MVRGSIPLKINCRGTNHTLLKTLQYGPPLASHKFVRLHQYARTGQKLKLLTKALWETVEQSLRPRGVKSANTHLP